MADKNAEDQEMEASAPKEKKRDFSKDPNAQKRLNAGKRSSKRNAGKENEPDAKPEESKAEDAAPDTTDMQTMANVAQEVQGFEEGGKVEELESADEGILADAPTEEMPAPTDAPTEEMPAPTDAPTEEMGERPMEAGEGGGIVEEALHEKQEILESPQDEQAESPEQQAQEMASGHEMHKPDGQDIGAYAPPEGESHDSLIDAYHEAVMFGDTENAKQLYRMLQNHRFAENTHRTKSEGQALQAENEYVAAAEELAGQYPELGEDGVPAQKVMALVDVYRNNGSSPAQALRQAVADLYKASAGNETPGSAPVPEAPKEAPMPEEPAMDAEAAPASEPEAEPASTDVEIPDMTERDLKKREISSTPASASAKQRPPEPPKAPNRSDAITEMKRKRGQAV